MKHDLFQIQPKMKIHRSFLDEFKKKYPDHDWHAPKIIAEVDPKGFISAMNPYLSFCDEEREADKLNVCLQLSIKAEGIETNVPEKGQYHAFLRSDFPTNMFILSSCLDGAIQSASIRLMEMLRLRFVRKSGEHTATKMYPDIALNDLSHIEITKKTLHLCFTVPLPDDIKLISEYIPLTASSGNATQVKDHLPEVKEMIPLELPPNVVNLTLPQVLLDYVELQIKQRRFASKEEYILDVMHKARHALPTANNLPPSDLEL